MDTKLVKYIAKCSYYTIDQFFCKFFQNRAFQPVVEFFFQLQQQDYFILSQNHVI